MPRDGSISETERRARLLAMWRESVLPVSFLSFSFHFFFLVWRVYPHLKGISHTSSADTEADRKDSAARVSIPSSNWLTSLFVSFAAGEYNSATRCRVPEVFLLHRTLFNGHGGIQLTVFSLKKAKCSD